VLICFKSINHRLKIIKYEYIKTFDFITNDDGVSAPGLSLNSRDGRIGDVLVVAPDKPQSGGMAMP
jgi:hypothetical protein